MEKLVLTTLNVEELKDIIRETVKECLEGMNQTVQETQKQNQILGVEEVCKIIGITRATVYSKVSRRELPYYKTGRKLYFKLDEIENYVFGNKVKTMSEIEEEANTYLSKRSYRRR